MEVTYALGVEMLLLVGASPSAAEARRRLEATITSGKALETMAHVDRRPGRQSRGTGRPRAPAPSWEVEFFRAPRDGVVSRVEPRRIGRGIQELGGGRRTIEDQIDPSVGFVIPARPGDRVKAGEPLASVFARNREGIEIGFQALREAIVIGDEGLLTPLITHRITASGVESLG